IIVDRDLAAVPASLAGFDAALADHRRLVVRYQPSRMHAAEILAAVHDAGLEIVDLSTLEADLQDLFLQLTRGDGEGGPSSPCCPFGPAPFCSAPALPSSSPRDPPSPRPPLAAPSC